MSNFEKRNSSRRFLNLLKAAILSFICMGILIGYHGAALINSIIGLIWFVFAMTAGIVLRSALMSQKYSPDWTAVRSEEHHSTCRDETCGKERSLKNLPDLKIASAVNDHVAS